MIHHGGMTVLWAVVVGMWIPGLTSLALRLVTGEGFRDVGWKPGPPSAWAWAYLGPAACAALTYGLSVLLGIVHFARPAKLGALPLPTDSALLAWFQVIVLGGTVRLLPAAARALGEELGWRGYLVPRLVRGEVPRPFVVSGVIWGLYHLPLILWGNYATSGQPLASAALFMALTVLGGVFFAWLRMSSGSIWPPVLAHAVHNIFYQGVFERWFQGPSGPYFAGEQGVFALLAYLLLLLWLRRRGAFSAGRPAAARAPAVVPAP